MKPKSANPIRANCPPGNIHEAITPARTNTNILLAKLCSLLEIDIIIPATTNKTNPTTLRTISAVAPSTNAATIKSINAITSIKAPTQFTTPCFSNIFFISTSLNKIISRRTKKKKYFHTFFTYLSTNSYITRYSFINFYVL